jgi:hypothetical protein
MEAALALVYVNGNQQLVFNSTITCGCRYLLGILFAGCRRQ